MQTSSTSCQVFHVLWWNWKNSFFFLVDGLWWDDRFSEVTYTSKTLGFLEEKTCCIGQECQPRQSSCSSFGKKQKSEDSNHNRRPRKQQPFSEVESTFEIELIVGASAFWCRLLLSVVDVNNFPTNWSCQNGWSDVSLSLVRSVKINGVDLDGHVLSDSDRIWPCCRTPQMGFSWGGMIAGGLSIWTSQWSLLTGCEMRWDLRNWGCTNVAEPRREFRSGRVRVAESGWAFWLSLPRCWVAESIPCRQPGAVSEFHFIMLSCSLRFDGSAICGWAEVFPVFRWIPSELNSTIVGSRRLDSGFGKSHTPLPTLGSILTILRMRRARATHLHFFLQTMDRAPSQFNHPPGASFQTLMFVAAIMSSKRKRTRSSTIGKEHVTRSVIRARAGRRCAVLEHVESSQMGMFHQGTGGRSLAELYQNDCWFRDRGRRAHNTKCTRSATHWSCRGAPQLLEHRVKVLTRALQNSVQASRRGRHTDAVSNTFFFSPTTGGIDGARWVLSSKQRRGARSRCVYKVCRLKRGYLLSCTAVRADTMLHGVNRDHRLPGLEWVRLLALAGQISVWRAYDVLRASEDWYAQFLLVSNKTVDLFDQVFSRHEAPLTVVHIFSGWWRARNSRLFQGRSTHKRRTNGTCENLHTVCRY